MFNIIFTCSSHVLLDLPLLLLPLTLMLSIPYKGVKCLSCTCPNHLNLFLLILEEIWAKSTFLKGLLRRFFVHPLGSMLKRMKKFCIPKAILSLFKILQHHSSWYVVTNLGVEGTALWVPDVILQEFHSFQLTTLLPRQPPKCTFLFEFFFF